MECGCPSHLFQKKVQPYFTQPQRKNKNHTDEIGSN